MILMKPYRVIVLLLLGLAFISGGVGKPSEKASAERKTTIVVYPVRVTGADKSLGPVLTTLLILDLSQSTKIKVIEETLLENVLERQGFANSDLCNSTICQIEIGKLTPAQKLLVSELTKLGQKFILGIRVIDIEKGEIDFSIKEEKVCAEDELDQFISQAALHLREKFGERIEVESLLNHVPQKTSPSPPLQDRPVPKSRESFSKVKYLGGMPGFEKKAKGTLEITNEKIVFTAKNGKFAFSIPVGDVTYVSTGEEVQRRWKSAVILSVIFSPIALALLAAKKKEENVGIEYKSEKGKLAGFPLFEVEKGQANSIKTVIEAKTGKTFKEDT